MKKILLVLLILIPFSCEKDHKYFISDHNKKIEITDELAFILGSLSDYLGYKNSEIYLHSPSENIEIIQREFISQYCQKNKIKFIMDEISEGGKIENIELSKKLDFLFENGVIKNEVIESFSHDQKMLFLISTYLCESYNTSYCFCNGTWKYGTTLRFLNETKSSKVIIKTREWKAFPTRRFIYFEPSSEFSNYLEKFKDKLEKKHYGT